jgi:CBS domain-containing protein
MHTAGKLCQREVVTVQPSDSVLHAELTVADVVSRTPVTANEREDIHEVVRRMRNAGVRRVPVVDAYGALVGVVAIDDVLELLAETLLDIAALAPKQRRRERHERR